MFDSDVMLPLGKTWTVPAWSRRTTVRSVIASTSPPVPLMAATSPTRTWFSRIRKKPLMTSLTSVCAPKPTARPTMPAPVRMGVMSRCSSRRIIRSAMPVTTAPSVFWTRVPSVRTRFSALAGVGAAGRVDFPLEAPDDHPEDLQDEIADEHDEADAQARLHQPAAERLRARGRRRCWIADQLEGREDQDDGDEDEDGGADEPDGRGELAAGIALEGHAEGGAGGEVRGPRGQLRHEVRDDQDEDDGDGGAEPGRIALEERGDREDHAIR